MPTALQHSRLESNRTAFSHRLYMVYFSIVIFLARIYLVFVWFSNSFTLGMVIIWKKDYVHIYNIVQKCGRMRSDTSAQMTTIVIYYLIDSKMQTEMINFFFVWNCNRISNCMLFEWVSLIRNEHFQDSAKWYWNWRVGLRGLTRHRNDSSFESWAHKFTWTWKVEQHSDWINSSNQIWTEVAIR